MLKRNPFFDEITDKDGESKLVFKMGKYRGEYLDDVLTQFAGRRYVEWMLNEMDIPDGLETWLNDALDEYEAVDARRAGAEGLH